MEHTCGKEKDIDRINERTQHLCKEVYGNGRPSLRAMTEGLSKDMTAITRQVSGIDSDIKCLLRFQTQIQTQHKEEEKLEVRQQQWRQQQRWLTGLVITSALSVLALVVTIVITLATNGHAG